MKKLIVALGLAVNMLTMADVVCTGLDNETNLSIAIGKEVQLESKRFLVKATTSEFLKKEDYIQAIEPTNRAIELCEHMLKHHFEEMGSEEYSINIRRVNNLKESKKNTSVIFLLKMKDGDK